MSTMPPEDNWMSVNIHSDRCSTGEVMLCEVGQISTYFLPVNTSRPVMFAFAWPCFPVLETLTSMHLHGWPLSMTCVPFFTSPARIGTVSVAPAEPDDMS